MKIKLLLIFFITTFVYSTHLNAQCDITLGSDIEVCYEDLPINLGDNLNITADPGYAIMWDNGLGSDPNPSVSPESTTTYTITLSDGACSDTDEITVTVHKPVADAGPDIQLCFGEEITLDGTGSYSDTPIFNYSWGPSFYVDADQEDSPTPTITMNSTGALQLTITDANFCSDTDQITVIVNSLPSVDAGDDYEYCWEGTPIVQNLSASPSGGTWSGDGITDPDGEYTGIGGGTDVLTYSYTNFIGCTSIDSIEVIINSPLPPDLGPDYGVCYSTTPIQLSTGGVWSGSNVTSDGLFTPISLGNNNLTFTIEEDGCFASSNLTIEVYDNPTADAGSDLQICSGLEVLIQGNTVVTSNPIASYSWTGNGIVGSSDELDVNVGPSGTESYLLTITDSEGCVATDEVTVSLFAETIVDAGADISVCDYTTPESITLSGFSPIPSGTESAQWIGPGITDPAGEYEYSGGGSHSLTYEFTDANGCITSDDIEVTIVTPDNVDAGLDQDLCLNAADLQLEQPGIWSGTNVTSNGVFSPVATGTFILDYEIMSGLCLSQDQIQITVHELPTADAGLDQTTCFGIPAMLSGSGMSNNMPIIDYAWSGGENIDTPNSQDTDVNPTFTQSYTLTVTDNEGCVASDDILISVNTLPNVNAGSDLDLCDQPIEEILTGFSPIPFGLETSVWSGTGITDPDGTFLSPGAGDYTLTYTFTDSNGCVNSDDIVVSVFVPITADAGSDDDICIGSYNHTLTGFTPLNGNWSGPGIIDSDLGIIDVMVAGIGTHTYTIEAGTGTCYTSDQMDLTIHDLPTANAGSDAVICFGEEIMINGSGNSVNIPIANYTWSGGENIDAPNSQNTEVQPTFTQSYTLLVTDSQGCQNTDDVEIVVNALPVVNAGLDIEVCDQPIAEILTGFGPLPSGSETGVWTGIGISDPAGEFTSPGLGDYVLTYTFTDGNSCSNSDDILVSVVGAVVADAGNDEDICIGNYNHTLTGFAPLNGSWSGPGIIDSDLGIIDVNATGLGTFTYTIESGSGTCYSSDEMELTIHDLPTVDAGTDDVICFGEIVMINGSGVSANMPMAEYVWSGGENIDAPNSQNTDVQPTFTQSYTLLVTDSQGCQNTDDVEIVVNALPVVNAGLDIEVCDQPIAEILTGFGPIPSGSETGVWTGIGISDPAGEFTSPGLGDYVLTYTFTDGNSCSNSDDILVSVVGAVVADAGNDEDICIGNYNHTLTGFAPLNGSWSGPGIIDSDLGIIDVNATGLGTFTYTIESGSGTCYSSDEMELTIHDLPTVDAGTDDVICFGEIVMINGSGVSANMPMAEYVWSGGENIDAPNSQNTDVQPTFTQSYTLLVTDSQGCQNTDDLEIVVNALPVVNAGLDIEVCDQPIVEILTGFSPIPSGLESGVWTGTGISDPDGEFTSPGVGTYTLTYTFTDGNTCVNSDDIIATVVAPELVTAGIDQSVCYGMDTYTIEGFSPSTGGSWVGPGIIDAEAGIIDLETAGVGTFNYTIEHGSGTCYQSDLVVIDIIAPPIVSAGVNEEFCEGIDPYDIAGSTPSGGTWYGEGIIDGSNGTFDDILGAQEYTMYYVYTDPTTSCADTSYKTVTIYDNPVADFDLTLTQCVDIDLDLNNLSTGATTYEWNFNNGDIEVGETPSYDYDSQGMHSIQLVAFNTFGCSDTITHSTEVVDVPMADFDVSAYDGCVSLEVDFTNNSLGDYEVYNWDFDNTNSSVDENPGTETFVEIANDNTIYNVVLTVSNLCGSTEHTETITIMSMPVADFSTDAVDFCGTTVTVMNTSYGNPTSYDWDWGDSSSHSSSEDPSPHDYPEEDTDEGYTIILTATNACGSDIADQLITIHPMNLEAGFSVDVDSGCMPLEVQVTDESEGAVTIVYDFGNTDSSVDSDPLYVYSGDGNFTLEQTVTSFCETETSAVNIDVLALPSIDFDLATIILCEGLDIEFNNLSDPLVQWNWNFDDGTFSNDEAPLHVFDDSGDYNVSLSGESTVNGCFNSYEESITVNDTPTSIFVADVIDGCAPLDVAFDNQSIDADSYDWYFDDSSSDTAENPTHTFVNTTDLPSSFFVTLVAQNASQCSHLSQVEIVVNPSPTADFVLSETESCLFPIEVIATDQSMGADSYTWDITDNGSFVDQDIAVTINSVGVFTFDLTVENAYSCTSFATADFEIHPTPIATFIPDVIDGCRDLSVAFDNQTTGAATFAWDFGDGDISTANSPSHTYDVPGLFDVELIAVSNEGCADTLSITDQIEVYDLPIADFSFSPEIIDIYDPIVDFENESLGGIIYEWQFGDGYDSDEENPTHEFQSTGLFQVTLLTLNEFGCADMLTKELEITSDLTLYVPNAFTPDNDGINDIFFPSVLGKEYVDYYHFQIFNRWGILLFETNDVNDYWVGDYNNGEYYVEPDSYNWIIEIRLSENVEIFRKKGTVNLLR